MSLKRQIRKNNFNKNYNNTFLDKKKESNNMYYGELEPEGRLEPKTYDLVVDDERDKENQILYSEIYEAVEKKDIQTVKKYLKLNRPIVCRHADLFKHCVSGLFEMGYKPFYCQFDHNLHHSHSTFTGDIAEYENMEVESGWHCLKWFIEFFESKEIPLPNIIFETHSDDGKRQMHRLYREYKLRQKLKYE